MPQIISLFKYSLLTLSLSYTFGLAYANTKPINEYDPNDRVDEKLDNPALYDDLANSKKKENEKDLSNLVENNSVLNESNEVMTREQTLQYFEQHPKELEIELAKMIRAGYIPAIKDYLPIYKKNENNDPSLVEWSEAIIEQSKGNMAKSISIFRKLNSEFPNVNILRFQLAIALVKNEQYKAALSELEKLNSSKKLKGTNKKEIEQLITAIKSKDTWSFYIDGNYTNNDNITNSPEEGTDYGNGWKAGARESGKGINFSISADKQWNYDNKMFTEVDLSTSGVYYWDNKNYNDVGATLGLGIGHQNKERKITFSPYFSKRYYGLGDSGNEKLHDYKDTVGARLKSTFYLDNQWKSNNYIGYAKHQYVEDYKNNDSTDYSASQTLNYNLSPTSYFYGGVDFLKRDSVLDYNSFNRQGIRSGWGKIWPKGFSTRTHVGYAKRQYQGYDFLGDKRKNHEYNAGLSVWNRNLHILGLTPVVNWNYNKTDSNSVREESESNDFTVSFSKVF